MQNTISASKQRKEATYLLKRGTPRVQPKHIALSSMEILYKRKHEDIYDNNISIFHYHPEIHSTPERKHET